MEDPIFDPWASVDALQHPEENAPPSERSPRPRKTARAPSPPIWWADRPQTPVTADTVGKGPDDDPVPISHPGDQEGLAGPVLTIVAEVLHDVAGKLEGAGHSTAIDDRSLHVPAGLRFRLRPRLGPFDESRGGGSVLEWVFCVDDPAMIAVRIWVDEFDTHPAKEVRIGVDTVTGNSVERSAVDFVRNVLQRS